MLSVYVALVTQHANSVRSIILPLWPVLLYHILHKVYLLFPRNVYYKYL